MRHDSEAAIGLARRLVAEGVGTCVLLMAIVGSGIMGERLADGNEALVLLANSFATGAVLLALILVLGPISGGHFNPAVTLAMARRGAIPRAQILPYVAVQIVGAIVGVVLAHAMFGLPPISASQHVRAGVTSILSESIATFGLLLVILGCARTWVAAWAVAAYILAAYWFTSSTSFATPAVTLARALTDSFSGIRHADVPGFLLGPAIGASAAVAVGGWLFSSRRPRAVTPPAVR